MKRILALLAFLLVTQPALACDQIRRLYGTATTIDFCLYITDATVGAVKVENAAHASGDTYLMKDEGNEANTTNGFVDEGSCYSIALTSGEMTAARILLNIEDQGTKAWADKCINIETYGNASAQFGSAVDANVTQWNGTAIPGVDTAGYPKVTIKDGTGTGEIDTNGGAVVSVTTTTNLTNGAASISRRW